MTSRRLISPAVLLLLLALPVHATVVAELSLEQALAHSEEVLVGEVVGSKVGQDNRGVIYTDWSLRVESCLNGCGDPGGRRVVRMPGGVLPGLGCHVEGVPGFELGERVLLFLDRAPDGSKRSVGLFQGVYTLVNTETGTWAEQKPSQGAQIVEQSVGESLPSRVQLWTFVEAIRRAEASR